MRSAKTSLNEREARRVARQESERRIHELYEQGNGCRRIAKVIERNDEYVYQVVRRLGIVRSRSEAYQLNHHIPATTNAFGQKVITKQLRSAAIGEAIKWFLERGYIASIPIEPARYDLIVESDVGLKRVQVKSTTFEAKKGKWEVRIGRTQYDPANVARTTAGKRKQVPYLIDEIDYFFIVTSAGKKYLIPIESVLGKENSG